MYNTGKLQLYFGHWASGHLFLARARSVHGGTVVAADMKLTIAQAAKKLLQDKSRKKLTVKDIVEECHITRQAFYYHFEDIPALFRWMLERNMENTVSAAQALDSGEERLRYFFVMALNSMPYVKKSMAADYGEDMGPFLSQCFQRLFRQVCDEQGLYQDCTRFELDLILRYHSHAILGLLRNWTEADTKNLDQIVHTVFRLMTDGISPVEKA